MCWVTSHGALADPLLSRLPHPLARRQPLPLVLCTLSPQVLDSSLETHVLRTDSSAVARECRDEMRKVNAALGKLDKWKRAERRELQGELRRLRKDERVRQERAVDEVLGGAQVTCCTLTGLQARGRGATGVVARWTNSRHVQASDAPLPTLHPRPAPSGACASTCA